MSRIRKMVKNRVNELAILEMQEGEEQPKPDMTTTSVRLNNSTIGNLDIVAERLKVNRSDLMREFLNAGVREALNELEVPPENWVDDKYKNLEKGDQDE